MQFGASLGYMSLYIRKKGRKEKKGGGEREGGREEGGRTEARKEGKK